MTAAAEKKTHPAQQLIAGGVAGFVEATSCHWIDTIKTRMQLRRQTTSVEKVVVKMRNSLVEPALRFHHSLQEPKPLAAVQHEPLLRMSTASLSSANSSNTHTSITVHPRTVQATLGPIGTARRIIEREGVLALYKVGYLIDVKVFSCLFVCLFIYLFSCS
jgi:hypothetical protein